MKELLLHRPFLEKQRTENYVDERAFRQIVKSKWTAQKCDTQLENKVQSIALTEQRWRT